MIMFLLNLGPFHREALVGNNRVKFLKWAMEKYPIKTVFFRDRGVLPLVRPSGVGLKLDVTDQ